LAILEKINTKKDENHTADSIKYQVLCDTTAMVAVVKKKMKNKNELLESKIKFGKKEVVAEDEEGAQGFQGGISEADLDAA